MPMSKAEFDIIASQKDDALALMQAARVSMLQTNPFYGVLVSGLPLVANWSWCDTAATDMTHIYYNPEFIMGIHPDRLKAIKERLDNSNKTPQEKQEFLDRTLTFYAKKSIKDVIFIIMHELRHITNAHQQRGRLFTDHGLFNQAGDHYINTSLVREMGNGGDYNFFPNGKNTDFANMKDFKWLQYCFCDFRFDKMTTEQIYNILRQEQEQQEQDDGNSDGDGDGKGQNSKGNGGGGDKKRTSDKHFGDPADSDQAIMGYDQPTPTRSAEAEQEAMEKSQELVESACQAAGDACPESIRELVMSMHKPRINYLDLIKRRMLSRRKDSLTYTRPARRSASLTTVLRGSGMIGHNQSIVLPGRKQKTQIDVVVAFDVSGSISQQTLNRIYSEIGGLISLYDEFKVTMFCWSTEVGNVEVYTKANVAKMKDYEVTTTYGTKASCVFEYIEKNVPKAKEVVVFTDGYIEQIDKEKAEEWARKYSTLWVITEKNENFTPPFGSKAVMDENAK